jgi:hypothetical protein
MENNKLEMKTQTMMDVIQIIVTIVLWGDFMSFYSRSYKVIALKGTDVTDEGKM